MHDASNLSGNCVLVHKSVYEEGSVSGFDDFVHKYGVVLLQGCHNLGGIFGEEFAEFIPGVEGDGCSEEAEGSIVVEENGKKNLIFQKCWVMHY